MNMYVVFLYLRNLFDVFCDVRAKTEVVVDDFHSTFDCQSISQRLRDIDCVFTDKLG
jgi:hypothetical protein